MRTLELVLLLLAALPAAPAVQPTKSAWPNTDRKMFTNAPTPKPRSGSFEEPLPTPIPAPAAPPAPRAPAPALPSPTLSSMTTRSRGGRGLLGSVACTNLIASSAVATDAHAHSQWLWLACGEGVVEVSGCERLARNPGGLGP